MSNGCNHNEASNSGQGLFCEITQRRLSSLISFSCRVSTNRTTSRVIVLAETRPTR